MPKIEKFKTIFYGQTYRIGNQNDGIAFCYTIKLEIEEIKKKLQNQDKNIELVFSYLDELITRQ